MKRFGEIQTLLSIFLLCCCLSQSWGRSFAEMKSDLLEEKLHRAYKRSVFDENFRWKRMQKSYSSIRYMSMKNLFLKGILHRIQSLLFQHANVAANRYVQNQLEFASPKAVTQRYIHNKPMVSENEEDEELIGKSLVRLSKADDYSISQLEPMQKARGFSNNDIPVLKTDDIVTKNKHPIVKAENKMSNDNLPKYEHDGHVFIENNIEAVPISNGRVFEEIEPMLKDNTGMLKDDRSVFENEKPSSMLNKKRIYGLNPSGQSLDFWSWYLQQFNSNFDPLASHIIGRK